jgi:excisionase family DNA binding protein
MIMHEAELPDLMTVKEAAEYLSVTPQTIRNLANDNLIDYVRIGVEYRIIKNTLVDSLKKTYQSPKKS